MTKRCVVCRMSFKSNTSTNVCSEKCRKVRKAQKDAEYKANMKSPYKKRDALSSMKLAEINALARKAGLTYGEYVARCCNG